MTKGTTALEITGEVCFFWSFKDKPHFLPFFYVHVRYAVLSNSFFFLLDLELTLSQTSPGFYVSAAQIF